MQERLPAFEIIVCPPSQSFRWNVHDYPHHLAKWHYHPEYELHLIQSSSGKMMIGDFLGDFEAGVLILTGPNLPHNWVSDIGENERVDDRDMLIQFSSDFASAMVEPFEEFQNVGAMLADAAHGVEFLGDAAREGAQRLAAIGRQRGAERLLSFMSLLDRLSRDPRERRMLARSAPALGIRTASSQRLQRAIDFLHENYTSSIRLQDVAELCGMEASNFSRFFKRQTGHSFARFVNQLRVHHACALLTGTQQPITEICFDSGFNNTANFNRQFAAICRQTPSEYREGTRRVSGAAELELAG